MLLLWAAPLQKRSRYKPLFYFVHRLIKGFSFLDKSALLFRQNLYKRNSYLSFLPNKEK